MHQTSEKRPRVLGYIRLVRLLLFVSAVAREVRMGWGGKGGDGLEETDRYGRRAVMLPIGAPNQ